MSEGKNNIINLPKNTPNSIGYVSVVQHPDGHRTFSTFISEAIYEVSDYYHLIYALNSASERDEFIIKLASPGGSIETGIILCNAIYNSKAKVTTQAMGICASIAAVMWCCGKRRSIVPTATLMFHMPSGFAGGKTADIEEQAGFFQEYFKELLPAITKNILTQEEYKAMVDGRQDIFINYEQLKTRLIKKGV